MAQHQLIDQLIDQSINDQQINQLMVRMAPQGSLSLSRPLTEARHFEMSVQKMSQF